MNDNSYFSEINFDYKKDRDQGSSQKKLQQISRVLFIQEAMDLGYDGV